MMFYKKGYLAIMIFTAVLCIGVIGIRYYLQNNVEDEKEIALDVSFSSDSGVYHNPFLLEMNCNGSEIYYTLDGSIPDKNSMKYETPILITDASLNENRYSMRTDVSTGFDKEEINKYSGDDPGYATPDYKIDKATIVKAVSYSPVNGYGNVKTAVYFVGEEGRTFNDNIKIISIVTDEDNLFDYKKGIYVTGETYKNYIKEYREAEEYYWREAFWALWMANYRNRGKQWEREADIFFFDNEGKLELEQTCGIRIHGGISRGYNPKSLNIYARKKYSGTKIIPLDFFSTGYFPDAITLFQGGNDTRTKAKDYLISSAVSQLNIATMNYEPYVLFLNGEYWGFYWLNEKYDANYFGYYYDVDAKNVILVKNGGIEEGDEDDDKYYSNMLKFCTNSDLTQESNYERVCNIIDIDSCIDYYAVMIYIGRCGDWPDSNYCLWRVKKEENGQYGDMRWRWAIFDLNSAGYTNDINPIEYVMDNDAMFHNLMQNREFCHKFVDKIIALSENEFSAENMSTQIESLQLNMTQAMKQNDKRFYGDDSLARYYHEMEELNSFFENRSDFLLPLLENYK